MNKYYYKNKNRFIQSNSNNTLELSQIKYFCIMSKLTRENLLNCYYTDILKKCIFIQSNKFADIEKIKERKNKEITQYFFTISPDERILDPLKLSNKTYYKLRYITNIDIELLNLNSNIFYNNDIINDLFVDKNL